MNTIRFQSNVAVAYCVLGAVVASLFSIFVSNLFGLAALVFWITDCWGQKRLVLAVPRAFWFVVAFVGFVVVAVLNSPDLPASAWYMKKMLKFGYFLLICTYFDRRMVTLTLRLLSGVLAGSALVGVSQYFWLKDVNLLNRIDGFMSHWMTFSGQLMLGLVLAVTWFLHRRSSGEPWKWPALMIPLFGVALLLTQTRSATLGALAGIGAVVALKMRFRWLLAGIFLLTCGFLLLPQTFKDRFYSSFDLQDKTTAGRIEHLSTGLKMVRSSPITGVGPRLIQERSAEFRGSEEFPEWFYQHLHNNLIQIAAELGLPALAAWLAFWLTLVWNYLIGIRKDASADAFVRWNALGAVTAFQVAGLFEYNFGDAEILILLLFLAAAPLAVDNAALRRNV